MLAWLTGLGYREGSKVVIRAIAPKGITDQEMLDKGMTYKNGVIARNYSFEASFKYRKGVLAELRVCPCTPRETAR